VADLSSTAQSFGNRLAKRWKHLRGWARGEGVTCFRVYDRDVPEVPLTVDWYEGRAVIGDRRKLGLLPDDVEEAWLDAMLDAAAPVLGVARELLFIKRRAPKRHKDGDQYERTGDLGAWFEVGEGGRRFHVNLSDYLDTGLFLDHRLTRAKVAAEASARRLLNLYCYTGAFTVHAAAAGAPSSTSVDLSRTYLDWAERNLALNGIDTRRHELIQADVREFLRDAAARPARWDLAVVDPPTFSNSKRMDYVFDIQRDHGALLDATARVLAPGGVIWFSTNRKRFELEPTDAMRGWRIDDLTRQTIPPDFRDATAHRVWRMVPAPPAGRA
jgi:23S rRNA G2069 N7-methylase RlmK/C1962 C5-methylase RlmI